MATRAERAEANRLSNEKYWKEREAREAAEEATVMARFGFLFPRSCWMDTAYPNNPRLYNELIEAGVRPEDINKDGLTKLLTVGHFRITTYGAAVYNKRAGLSKRDIKALMKALGIKEIQYITTVDAVFAHNKTTEVVIIPLEASDVDTDRLNYWTKRHERFKTLLTPDCLAIVADHDNNKKTFVAIGKEHGRSTSWAQTMYHKTKWRLEATARFQRYLDGEVTFDNM